MPAKEVTAAIEMKLHVITTGGTIDKVYFDAKSEYEVGEPQVLEDFSRRQYHL